ncbi:hypothetical protein [Pseudolysinimonas sp.]|uniref:hypothetical protein n=1 Tax=Pseudolysinimonas sp. TaxID=2680009 RepID=UPI003264204D
MLHRRALPVVLLVAMAAASLTSCATASTPGGEVVGTEMSAELWADAERISASDGISVNDALDIAIGEAFIDDRFAIEQLVAYQGDGAFLIGVGVAAYRRGPLGADLGATRERFLAGGFTIEQLLSNVAVAAEAAEDTSGMPWLLSSRLITAAEARDFGLVTAATWGPPSAWPGNIPEPRGMTLRSTRISVALDGSVRAVDMTVADTTQAAVDAWEASLPREPLTSNVFTFPVGDEFTLSLTYGGSEGGVPDSGLPPAWSELLPLGPSSMAFRFAGTTYDFLPSGTPDRAPTFSFGLETSNRISVYREWLEHDARGGWTVVTASDTYFTAENADFVVSGQSQPDGTDALSITVKSWDLPGLERLAPE